MKRYINCQTEMGLETLDAEDSNDYVNKKVFFKVLLNTLQEYQISGHNAYISTRATREWYNR